MTEGKWLACTDPQKMLELLGQEGWLSDRRLRLLLCGWSRLNWKWLPDESRSALEVAESFADGLEGDADREAADMKLWQEAQKRHANLRHWHARLTLVAKINLWGAAEGSVSANPVVRARQASVVRDVFNPFLRVSLNPTWLAWNCSTVVKLSQAIYDERAFDRLPVLADALEEAGCHDAHILGHCRHPGPHGLGCWVVDLLLGKS